MDCPKNEAFDYIRTSFICGCNEFLAAYVYVFFTTSKLENLRKVVATHSKIAEIAAGVMDYRKKEVDEVITLIRKRWNLLFFRPLHYSSKWKSK